MTTAVIRCGFNLALRHVMQYAFSVKLLITCLFNVYKRF